MARKRLVKKVKKIQKMKAKKEKERAAAEKEAKKKQEKQEDIEEVEEVEKEDEKEDEEEDEEEEEEVGEGLELPEYSPSPKPKLSKDVKKALKQRKAKKSKQPYFVRQEVHRYKKLPMKWRKPKGLHSKLRKHIGYRPNVVSIGFRGPRKARGLHPSGFKEVLVHNVKEAEVVDPKTEAIRIAKTVGTMKREAIEERIKELEDKKDVRYYILNPLKNYDVVTVHQPSDLERLDHKEQAAFIPASVGKTMRRAIIEKAREMAETKKGVKILNVKELR